MSETTPHKLTDEQWAAIQAKWATGATSNRQLAVVYGISEAAIRKKAKTEGWERDLAAINRVHDEAAVRTIQAAFADEVRTRELAANSPETQAELREEVTERAIASIVEFNINHLSRVAKLEGTAGRVQELIDIWLADDDGSPEATAKRQAAADRLFVGRGDGMSSVMTSLARTSESIQNQIRKAIGADDRAQRVELSGPGGSPIQTEGSAIDFSQLSTADAAVLYEAARVMEGKRERSPIPLPPAGPGEDGE